MSATLKQRMQKCISQQYSTEKETGTPWKRLFSVEEKCLKDSSSSSGNSCYKISAWEG